MADYCSVGKFRCKYCYDGECYFFDMGSGNISDLPCRNRNNSTDNCLEDDNIE